MDTNYTHVSLLVDRSGSMGIKEAIRKEAEAAVNNWITEQKAVDEGRMTLTLVEFDSGVGDWYHVVHQGDIKDAPTYTLKPRGMTSLLDAVGRIINETGEFLTAMPEAERPGQVLIVIQTDGGENNSTEFNHAQVTEMKEHQENRYNWEFVFMGMGLEASQEGQRLGFAHAMTADNSDGMYATAFRGLSNATTAYRGGAGGQSLASMNVDLTGADAHLLKQEDEDEDLQGKSTTLP